MFRKTIFLLHLTVALFAGPPVLMMAATGVVLSFEGLVATLVERQHEVSVPQAPVWLPPETLAQSARTLGSTSESPFIVTALRYAARPDAPVRASSGRDRHVFVDPYTGDALGYGLVAGPAFFAEVREWHRWFNLPDRMVRRGRSIAGLANLLFIFLLLTGPVLWWPEVFSKRALAPRLLFGRNMPKGHRNLRWHRVVGIWSVAPLAAIAATGALTSYPALADRVHPVAGELLPVNDWPPNPEPGRVAAESPGDTDDATLQRGGRDAGAGGRDAGAGVRNAGAAASSDADLAAVVASAADWVPGWHTLTLSLPVARDGTARVLIHGGRSGRPHSGTLVLDGATGSPFGWEPFSSEPPAGRAREILQRAHTGEYWGTGGQIAAGAFSLAAATMVWTGLAMALRRLRRWRSTEARIGSRKP